MPVPVFGPPETILAKRSLMSPTIDGFLRSPPFGIGGPLRLLPFGDGGSLRSPPFGIGGFLPIYPMSKQSFATGCIETMPYLRHAVLCCADRENAGVILGTGRKIINVR
jgi:hypothetical protein